MKKLISTFGAILIAFVLLVSCSSIDSDAQKVAELQWKAQQATQKVLTEGQSAIEEGKKLAEEADALYQEMLEKYNTEEGKEKFELALRKAIDSYKL